MAGKITQCPRRYADSIPPACQEFCPIAGGQDVAERFYTSVSILKPGAPFYRQNDTRKYPAMYAEIAALAGGIVRTDRGIPECAAIAYRERQETRKARGEARRARKQFNAERRARGEKIKRPRKPATYTGGIITEIVETLTNTRTKARIKNAIRTEETKAVIASARGQKYRPAPLAAIGRKYERSRERVRQIKEEMKGA